MADLSSGALHSGGDDLGAVGRAAHKPLVQFLHRRRQDENADDIAAGDLEKLLRALPVNIEQHILAGRQHRIDLGLRRAVALAKNMRPFEEFVIGHHIAKPIKADEMIILAVFLAGPNRPRGRRNRHIQIGFIGEQLARDRRFSGTRGRRQDEQNAPAPEFVQIVVGSFHAR